MVISPAFASPRRLQRAPQRPPTWYKPDFKVVNGRIRVPETPGMGLEIDGDFLAGAEVVAKITERVKNRGSEG